MHNRLAEILGEKKREIKRIKREGMPQKKGNELLPLRDFRGAISVPNRTNLIAEIKFASPSAGDIRKEEDPTEIGRIYEYAGASAISLLTDKKFFRGDLSQLPLVKRAISLPVLRKDFIIDELQVKESFYWGADAILLIVRILSTQQLKELLDMSKDLGMDVLTEVHTTEEIERAIDCGAEIIGINNRDLDSFEVDINTTMKLAGLIPDDHIIVSESGINDGEDIHQLRGMGIQAVLVGSALMRSDDLRKKTEEMVEAGCAN